MVCVYFHPNSLQAQQQGIDEIIANNLRKVQEQQEKTTVVGANNKT